MKRETWVRGVAGSLLLATPAALAAVKITSIDFKGTSNPSVLEIRGDGPLTVEKETHAQDKQLVLDFKDATLAKSVSRAIDTSSFNSSVLLISPNQIAKDKSVRVVVQLRESATTALSTEVEQKGNTVKLSFPSDTVSTSAAAPTSADSVPVDSSGAVPVAEAEAKPTSGQVTVDDFVRSRERGQFTGKPITLQVRDVDVHDVFRLISDASGFNIILGDDVKGKLTLSLVDVPWDQALEVVLNQMRLSAERNNNILRILTQEALAKEKTLKLQTERASKAVAPRVTRVFPISYAKLDDLEKTISQMLTPAATPGQALESTAKSIVVDQRTNSLIVYDTLENIERVKKLVEVLDVQTPQVMIEGKVVEASEQFTRSLGGNVGVGAPNGAIQTFGSFNGGNPVVALLGNPSVFNSGTSGGTIGATSNPSVPTYGSAGLGFLIGGGSAQARLNAILSMGESESKIKVISSPKAVVLSKQNAKIVEGTPVAVPVTNTVSGVGSSQGIQVQNANLSLDVTPTVTNDGSVLLDLSLTRDLPQVLGGTSGSGIATRNIKTSVLVESGSTLVLGGFYSQTANEGESGFPFLRKIPIIGWFFGSETSDVRRSELFFFVTPRVINAKKTGIGT